MYVKRTILFTISVLLLATLLYSLDYDEFFRAASKLTFGSVALLLILQAVIMLLNSLKWYVLLRRYAVSFVNVFTTSLIGSMVNNLTPAGVAGGEPIKAYVLSRIDKIKMEKAFATVFVDLFVTILPVLLLDLLAIMLIFHYSFDLRIAWLLAIISLFLIALIAASFSILLDREPSMKFFNRLLAIFARISFLRRHVLRVESRVDELFSSFHRGIKDNMMDVWTLSVALLISSLVWVLSIVRIYLIFVLLGVSVNFDVILIVYTVMVTVGALPLLPGAIGLWEWVGTGLFTLFGISLEVAAVIVFLDRILFFWAPIIAGFLASLHVGLNVMRLVDRPE
ncbi:MAG: flippase-like domain-containing protein [Candidatus Altiarchaeota archaeon]